MRRALIWVGVGIVGFTILGALSGAPQPTTNAETLISPSPTATVVIVVTPTATPTLLQVVTPTLTPKPLSNDNYYQNTDGVQVHAPAYAPSRPVNASARCRDGTYSFSAHRSGTCSGHGGVAQWY